MAGHPTEDSMTSSPLLGEGYGFTLANCTSRSPAFRRFERGGMDLTEELQQLGLLEGSLRQAGTTGRAVVMIPRRSSRTPTPRSSRRVWASGANRVFLYSARRASFVSTRGLPALDSKSSDVGFLMRVSSSCLGQPQFFTSPSGLVG